MKRKLLILLTMALSLDLYAIENTLLLRGGLATGITLLQSNNIQIFNDDNPEERDDDETIKNFGVHSQFAYKWKKWELMAASHITFGKIDSLHFSTNGRRFYGGGGYRNVTIAPAVKYVTNWEPVKSWNFYFSAGPIWALQTVNLEHYQTDSELTSGKYKLAYESVGAHLNLGLEEFALYKEMHPVYLELSIFAIKSYRVSVVDTSDFKRVDILSASFSRDDIESYSVLISMGILIF